VAGLSAFGEAYRDELIAAILDRLGLASQGTLADTALVQAAFKALAAGGDALRWEPFFFDWFCKDEARALAGPRAALYGEAAFAPFREALAPYNAVRRERLAHDYFHRPEPEELLYDEIEALWAPVAERDDWTPFHAKLAAIETAREAWGFTAQASIQG
jgi:uncharacterized protein YdiU (UPF0061 family)